MEYTKFTNGDICKISIQGNFLFGDHSKFKEIIDTITSEDIKAIELDVSGIKLIDSSGMGMFLLAKEAADKKAIKLTLMHPQGQIAQMFSVSKFNDMFNVVE